jgi:SAM-dependent methyltransferase
MKTILTDLLICPACLPQENGLTCDIMEKRGEDVLYGSLLCGQCRARYPIQDGIASMLSRSYPENNPAISRYESSILISSYLWSHYADLLGDSDAAPAYMEWAKLFDNHPGFFLDAGCAVGRFTFEMSNKSDFVIGIDNSHSFIRKARHLMINRKLDFSIPIEGMITEQQVIELPTAWSSKNVDFIVGDVQCLPFRSNSFTSLASLNLVDKLPVPLDHLKEMNRVAREKNAQFLFSDPFSWTSEIAREENWLGGTVKGPYPGKGFDNIIRLFTGKGSELQPLWMLEKKGHIWWKIRNHRNHFELIRSCFIKAER